MAVYGSLQYPNIRQKARKLPFCYSIVFYGIFRLRASLSARKKQVKDSDLFEGFYLLFLLQGV